MLHNVDTATIWMYSLIAGVVVIAVVALLLILIVVAANRVAKHAEGIWAAGKQIAGNTVSIWMLNTTNSVAGDILATAGAINDKAASMDVAIKELAAAVALGA